MMRRMRDVGEFGMIERLARILPTSPSVLEGIGDDCAVLRVGDRQLLVSCDLSVENVHFRREGVTGRDIGWKVAASALSDIAAMGGAPQYCLTACACSPSECVTYLEDIFQGMMSVLSRFGAVVVGGDTTRSGDGITLDVTVIGEAIGGRYLRRRGAQVGDHLFVTGHVGLSAAGLHALGHGVENEALVRAHMYPQPRILEGQWLCGHSVVHAMIDISDGLIQDAGHLARASRLGIDLHPERLHVAPELRAYCESQGLEASRIMLTGGEDYELLFAVDSGQAEAAIDAFHHEFHLETTRIGTFTDEWTGVRIGGETPAKGGFDHFKTED